MATHFPTELSLATCQAENTVAVAGELADYLSRRLDIPVRFLKDIAWQDAYAGIEAGAIDIGWICGRPYVQLVDQLRAPLRLLAAPVMAGARYQDRPVYFSDVIIRRGRPFRSFSDLEGASWAYNEPGSQSGYHITCYQLSCLQRKDDFFGRVVQAGSHRRSIFMVIDGQVDAAAIDCTVLEWEMVRHPEISEAIEIIDTLGPSPIPPLVISTNVPASLVAQIQQHLHSMHVTAAGQRVLKTGGLARFQLVSDADYDEIRRMSAASCGISL